MSLFKNGDVVCCLGDSITAAGLWMAEAYQHVSATRDVKFYNCGVSGGRADLACDYMYGHCLAKNPTYTAIMFGVNDIDRWALSSSYTGGDSKETVERAVANYKVKLELIVKRVLEFGSKVILCTPPPYDEYNDRTEENLGCEFALIECSETVRELSKKYGTALVDFREKLLPHIKDGNVIETDRIHPTPYGYHMMGQIFLAELGEIAAPDFDTPFVPEPWNDARMKAEKIINNMDFAEYVLLWQISKDNDWGVFKKVEEAKKRYDAYERKEDYIAQCLLAYVNYADRRIELDEKLISLTPRPKNA